MTYFLSNEKAPPPLPAKNNGPPGGVPSGSPWRKREEPLMIREAGECREEDIFFVNVSLLIDFNISQRLGKIDFKTQI